MKTKICTKCKTEQPIEAFCKSKYSSQKTGAISHGRSSWCRTCILAQKKEYYSKNYDKIQKNVMAWRSKNKERYRGYMKKRYDKDKISGVYHNKKLQKLYGISLLDYNKILKSQNGCCAICKSDPSEESKKLVVDHCHETGIIRGLLCERCNFALGLIFDSPAIANRLADYLNLSYEVPSWKDRIKAKNGWRRAV